MEKIRGRKKLKEKKREGRMRGMGGIRRMRNLRRRSLAPYAPVTFLLLSSFLL